MVRVGYAITTCKCGKQCYETKQSAKAGKRRLRLPVELRPYQCEIPPHYFHLGNLSEAVISGQMDRGIYDDEGRARRLVSERAKNACEVCGGPGYEYSHRQTRALQGEHRWCPCNGVFSCRTCHAGMHTSPMTARSKGLHVSRYKDLPGTVPVILRRGWVLLDCDGGITPLKDSQVSVEWEVPTLVGGDR